LEKHIKKLANKHFPKGIKEWMKLKKRLDQGKLDLMGYVRRLARLNGNVRPTLSILLAAEQSNDVEVMKSAKAIKAKELFREIEQTENDVAASFLNTARDRDIFRYYKGIQLLRRLKAIEVSSEEYDAVKETITALNTRDIADFISRYLKQSLVLSKQWESNIRYAIRFYEVAKERDQAVADSIKQSPDEISVLVFGGFHKSEIRNQLRENGFSYAILTPKITKISRRHQEKYRHLMSAGISGISISSKVRMASRYLSLIGYGEHFRKRSEVRNKISRKAAEFGYRSEMRMSRPDSSESDIPTSIQELLANWQIRPDPLQVLRFSQEQIHQGARLAGFEFPKMELTLLELGRVLPYLREIVDSILDDFGDHSILILGRDADLFYDAFRVLLAGTDREERIKLFPGSKDFWYQFKSYPKDMRRRFFSLANDKMFRFGDNGEFFVQQALLYNLVKEVAARSEVRKAA